MPAADPILGYIVYIYIYIYIYVLFLIILYNILYLKYKIADNLLKIAILYKYVDLLKLAN
jgi:hypothetical protein